MNLLIFYLFLGCANAEKSFFDSFSGRKLTDAEVRRHEEKNTTFWCVNKIEENCNPHAFRRLDGSCNNLRHIVAGSTHTPFVRVLPDAYRYVNGNYNPRLTKCGKPLPPSRWMRTELLLEGRRPDLKFTTLFTHMMLFYAAEVAAIHDSVKYILWVTYCCEEKGKYDRQCTPNLVPDDDPVLRFTDIRCINMTRPETFQATGCVRNGTVPQRINSGLPLYEGSIVYGSIASRIAERTRAYEGGFLKYDLLNGKMWPANVGPGQPNICLMNQKPHETRCHASADDTANSLLGISLGYIWFLRFHNYIASELAKMNPCWGDDTLFHTARDINIAYMNEIYIKELLGSFFGKDNLIRDGVIQEDKGYVEDYDEKILPQLSLEYIYALRWFHTMQDGRVKMYDSEGNYMKQVPITNLTLRTGYLALGNHLEYMTHGATLQPSGAADYAVDPEMAERVLGGLQKLSDVFTNDHAKGKFNGFQPYIKYVEHCSGPKIKSFDDLRWLMLPQRVELLKDTHKHIEDIELLSGLWLESPIEGGHGPPTLYCLVVDQLIRNRRADRHWYERSNRPHAFTERQLQVIRTATMAGVLCDVGDGVTKIQPRACERAGPGNEVRSCRDIPRLDVTPWLDHRCKRHG